MYRKTKCLLLRHRKPQETGKPTRNPRGSTEAKPAGKVAAEKLTPFMQNRIVRCDPNSRIRRFNDGKLFSEARVGLRGQIRQGKIPRVCRPWESIPLSPRSGQRTLAEEAFVLLVMS